METDILLKDENLWPRWKQIYDERRVLPFEVRYMLRDWFEKHSWRDLTSDKDSCHGGQVYMDLIGELNIKISDQSLDQLHRIQLHDAKLKIEEQFKNQPAELIEVIQNCLNHESLLVRSVQADQETHDSTEEDIELMKYHQREKEILQIINDLKSHNQNLERTVEHFHDIMQDTASEISNLQDEINILSYAAATNGNLIQQNTVTCEQNRQKINQLGSQVIIEKKKLVNELKDGVDNIKKVLHACWAMVKDFKLQQKQRICFIAKPPEGAIEILNRVFEESSCQLISLKQYIVKVLEDIELITFVGEDTEKGLLQDLQATLHKLVQKHLQEAFILTKQPQNILKIANNKSNCISTCVRILGGLGFGLENSLPRVEVMVYREPKLCDAMTADHQIESTVCEKIENGTAIMKRCVRSIQANLNKVILRGVRPLQKGKDDRVPEMKYGMIFYTKVTVGDMEVPLKALSLPIVLVTQTSQEVDAKGTLVWDAAFSPEDRMVYEEEDNIEWPRMEEVLKGLFQETGRTLDQQQLDYLASYIFSRGQAQAQHIKDDSRYRLKKVHFMRDKLPQKNFTFWTWIYSCKNLIINHVSQEWKDKLIHGFIGKSQAEECLKDQPQGTFIVRFRENRLEDGQGAHRSACLGVVVSQPCQETGEMMHHVSDFLRPMDIHRHSLMRILLGYVYGRAKQPLLQILHGGIIIQSLVDKYLPDPGDGSVGYKYKRGKLLIEVDLVAGPKQNAAPPRIANELPEINPRDLDRIMDLNDDELINMVDGMINNVPATVEGLQDSM